MGSWSRKREDNVPLSVGIGGGLGGCWVPRKVPLGPEFGIRVAVDSLRQEERIPGRGCTHGFIEVEAERGWVCSRMGSVRRVGLTHYYSKEFGLHSPGIRKPFFHPFIHSAALHLVNLWFLFYLCIFLCMYVFIYVCWYKSIYVST